VIFYDNYAISIDCIIRDEAASGAKVDVSNNSFVPNECVLLNKANATITDVSIVWRKGRHLGLKFVSNPIDLYSLDKKDVRRRLIVAIKG
jgi:hypothetical protein